ncbi:hypothetical protein [Martelella soudanensis]|uniref:hypothetical protein n=1 Tax=unclassified Martelella TaxID=2629616 RepID=UPI0015DEED0E|nr:MULTISPECIES: hypothetical protein [unclassified Martelella]
MANQFTPQPPEIVSIQKTSFVGQPAAIISGTEDLSGVPSGHSIGVKLENLTVGAWLTYTPVTVNSDGTWNAVVPSTSGDEAIAWAIVMGYTGPNSTSDPSKTFVLP